MKKSKFGSLNFDSVETLSRKELKKVTGGYGENTTKMCVKWSPMTSTWDVVVINLATQAVITVVKQNISPASSSYGPC